MLKGLKVQKEQPLQEIATKYNIKSIQLNLSSKEKFSKIYGISRMSTVLFNVTFKTHPSINFLENTDLLVFLYPCYNLHALNKTNSRAKFTCSIVPPVDILQTYYIELEVIFINIKCFQPYITIMP